MVTPSNIIYTLIMRKYTLSKDATIHFVYS
nr:MAG TPA: hypothetical protein [Caudoviricetes sp.]DAU90995.1 MAG TPA: hypothetical protein [Caudoviricetes sp.]